MAIYVVKITLPYENYSSRFAVMHSTSETMFSPIFGEEHELIAHMFAAEYWNTRDRSRDYTEAAQEALAADLHAFFDATFPRYQETCAPLPDAWRALLALAQYYNDDESEVVAMLDVDDLLEWYRDGDTRADIAQAAFRAWRRARQLRVTA